MIINDEENFSTEEINEELRDLIYKNYTIETLTPLQRRALYERYSHRKYHFLSEKDFAINDNTNSVIGWSEKINIVGSTIQNMFLKLKSYGYKYIDLNISNVGLYQHNANNYISIAITGYLPISDSVLLEYKRKSLMYENELKEKFKKEAFAEIKKLIKSCKITPTELGNKYEELFELKGE